MVDKCGRRIDFVKYRNNRTFSGGFYIKQKLRRYGLTGEGFTETSSATVVAGPHVMSTEALSLSSDLHNIKQHPRILFLISSDEAGIQRHKLYVKFQVSSANTAHGYLYPLVWKISGWAHADHFARSFYYLRSHSSCHGYYLRFTKICSLFNVLALEQFILTAFVGSIDKKRLEESCRFYYTVSTAHGDIFVLIAEYIIVSYH